MKISRFAAVLLLAACARSSPPSFRAAEELGPGQVGTAPLFIASPDGGETAAWVSAPNGGSDGRLYVRVDGRAPVELRDSLGPIEPQGNAPPRIAYSPDGALNALYAVTRLAPGRRFPAAALRFARSTDGGAHWSTPVTVTDDTVLGSHDFPALFAAPDGALYASWLDGRTGQSRMFITRSTDGGRFWIPHMRVAEGESCPGRTAMASGPGGMLYLAWREVRPGKVRDVVVARSGDRGMTWEEPVRVHADDWVFDDCPQAAPSIQVDTKGSLHVAWWTGRRGMAGVWYARSDNGALTFSKPIPLGVAALSRPAHVQLALGGEDRVIVAWDDGTLAVPRVVVRLSKDRGAHWSVPVALSDSGRAAGFPVVVAARERVAVAWSEQSPAGARVLVRRGTLE